MSSQKNDSKRFAALVRKHEKTIQKISASYYVLGSYSYHELANDLTTYLWQVFRDLPAETVIDDENAWVFVVLSRHARDLVRNERTYQSKLVYGANLTGLADDSATSSDISRLYRLIKELDKDDREEILMYIDKVPIKQIAVARGKKYLNTYRNIARIRKKLSKLNTIVPDEDEICWPKIYNSGETKERDDESVKT